MSRSRNMQRSRRDRYVTQHRFRRADELRADEIQWEAERVSWWSRADVTSRRRRMSQRRRRQMTHWRNKIAWWEHKLWFRHMVASCAAVVEDERPDASL